MKVFFLSLIFITPLLCSSQNVILNLNNNWKFKQSTSSNYLPAKVPGSVHTDLLNNKLIPDPFFGSNGNQLYWIDSADWNYQLEFNIDNNKLFQKKNIDLIFDGLDTYADVYINNHLAITVNNMFRQWSINIKPFIVFGKNNLTIHFKSAKKYVDSIAVSNLPIVRPDNSRVYARKAQFQFGWDWGPTFIGAGIWKKVWIDGYDELSTNQKLQLKKDELNNSRKKEIKLIQQPDSNGVSFYFEKNGKPIYMKGANWIPASIFPGTLIKEDYLKLLVKAKDANMNMLRIWGGGIYESDDFYDLCDSMGIYVWQDFMFAGGMYPADKYFLENVKSEVKYQIERLRHHPCIVLWCGNNEIDEAWHNWGWQTQFNLHNEDSIKIWKEYKTLFKDSLAAWVNEFDGSRPYVSTSPQNGWGHNESFSEGDSHYWGLWWGLEDWEVFKNKTGRFVSEYGMQSMSNFSTIKTYTKESDRFLYSEAIKSHQKASDGFNKLNHYLTRYFIDSTSLSKLSLSDYTYLSQCMQAFILKNTITTHRNQSPRNMGTLLWQLNDCWPVTSWSIVDYSGAPKAAWYAVKRAYSNDADIKIDNIDRLNLLKNQPKFTLKITGEHSFSITSTCDAKYVYLTSDFGEYKLSDNYFDIKKGEIKNISIQNGNASDKIIKHLNVYSLNQFYYKNLIIKIH